VTLWTVFTRSMDDRCKYYYELLLLSHIDNVLNKIVVNESKKEHT